MHASIAILFAAALFATTGDTAMASSDARDHAIAVAKETLGRDLGIDVRRISVAKADVADWRDGSLGCPRPGMSYTQALVSGYRVLLSVASATYELHVAGDRAVRCDRAASKSVDAEATVAGLRMAELARQDLAKRLNAETSDIAIESIRPVRWPDANLPCPESTNAFTAEASGFVIRLSAGGQQFVYHTDYERVVPCRPQSPCHSD